MTQPRIGRQVYEEAMRDKKEEADPKAKLEEAARFLLDYLTPEAQSQIRAAAAEKHMPVWQLLLGYVMRAADRGEIWTTYMLSSWESAHKPGAPRPCKSCGLVFGSEFAEAAYCCNPCACGKLAILGHAESCSTKELQTVSA